MNQPILECKNICFSYHNLKGETRALTDISFQVNKGEFLAIVGPSGCGNGMVYLGTLWSNRLLLPAHLYKARTKQINCRANLDIPHNYPILSIEILWADV